MGISSADADVDGQEPKKEDVKRSKIESETMLKNAMNVIDGYKSADEIQKNARLLLKEKADIGMHKTDQEKLTKYISAQYASLKSETNETT